MSLNFEQIEGKKQIWVYFNIFWTKNLDRKTKLAIFAAHKMCKTYNINRMKIQEYKTKEEAIAAFRKALGMRSEYEARVRRYWEEMKSSSQSTAMG